MPQNKRLLYTPLHKKALECDNNPEQSFRTQNHMLILHSDIFFYPDYTVGLGVSPNHAPLTTQRQAHGLYHR